MSASREARKQDMMNAILQIYVSQGLENTSMRDIAAALKINKTINITPPGKVRKIGQIQ